VDLKDDSVKTLLKSRTFWKEVLLIVGSCAAYASNALSGEATLGAIAFGVAGIIIRTVTSKEITGFFKG